MKVKNATKNLKVLKFKLALTIFFLAFSLTSFGFVTFSWFSNIRSATIQNANYELAEPYKYTTSVKIDGLNTTSDVIKFENIFPGCFHSRNLEITINNIDSKTFYIDLIFNLPTELEESPFIDTLGI